MYKEKSCLVLSVLIFKNEQVNYLYYSSLKAELLLFYKILEKKNLICLKHQHINYFKFI